MFASVVCNAAIAKKFLTDILANGPVVPLAPRSTDQQPHFPLSPNPHGTAQTARLGIQTFKDVWAFRTAPSASCASRADLVLPRARRRFWPTCAMQSHLDGIGVKVFGISNVNSERLRHIAIQSNRHRLFAQGKRERTGCFAGLRRLIWFHVDCDVSARRCGLKTKRLWFWFDRHPTRHPGRRRSTRASREHKNDDAIGRDGGNLPNSHETILPILRRA